MRTSRTVAVLIAAALGATTFATVAPAPALTGPPAARVPLTLGAEEVVTTFAPASEEAQDPYPLAVADHTGAVTAVWADNGLRAAQRDAAGHWSTPVTLGSCAGSFGNCVSTYALVVDVAGNTTAAWAQWDTARTRVYVSSLPRGGNWSNPYLLGTQRRAGVEVAAAAGREGAAVVAYGSWSRTKGQSVDAVYKAPGVSWSAARHRSFADAQQPAIGMSARGAVVMVVRRTGSADDRMRAYRYRPNTGWSHAKRLGSAMHYDWPPYNLAVAPTGRTVLAYRYDPTSTAGSVGRPVMRARIMNRHGVWGPIRTLSRPGTVRTEIPLVAAGRDATVVWSTTHHAIHWATKAPRHAWDVRTAYPRRAGDVMQLDRNNRGDLVLLWLRWTMAGTDSLVGVHTATLGWSSRLRIPSRPGDVGAGASVAALPGGSALAVVGGAGAGMPATYDVTARKVTPAP